MLKLLLNFQAELVLAYEDYLGDNSTILNNSPSFFEYVSFFVKGNGDTVRFWLHIGDVVSIDTMEFGLVL